MGNQCSPQFSEGCPDGFSHTYDCSWVWWVDYERCDFVGSYDDNAADLLHPASDVMFQGSQYNVVGECTNTPCGASWGDLDSCNPPPAPQCLSGDTEEAVRISCCGAPFWNTGCNTEPSWPVSDSGVKEIRTCNDGGGNTHKVFPVYKRGASCDVDSSSTPWYEPEYSCHYQQTVLGRSNDAVVDCWVPYMAANNECIAYDPAGEGGWIQTRESDGTEMDGQNGRRWPQLVFGGNELAIDDPSANGLTTNAVADMESESDIPHSTYGGPSDAVAGGAVAGLVAGVALVVGLAAFALRKRREARSLENYRENASEMEMSGDKL